MLIAGPSVRVAWVLLALACTAPGPASAQHRVYKQVGPDGSVTFTDKPPAGQAAAPLAAHETPAAAALPAPSEAAPGTSDRHFRGAKKAIRKDQAATAGDAADSARAAPDPAVSKGLVALMGYESIVDEFLALCVKTLPTSYKRYDGAAQAWKSRHANVLARYPMVLRENFSPAQQETLRTLIKGRTQSMLAPVLAAGAAQRIKWCDDNAQELHAGKMDLGRDHVDALLNDRRR